MPYAKRYSCCTCYWVLCNSQALKTRQTRHCSIRRRSRLAGCYAIEIDHRLKGALQPDCVLNCRREVDEFVERMDNIYDAVVSRFMIG